MNIFVLGAACATFMACISACVTEVDRDSLTASGRLAASDAASSVAAENEVIWNIRYVKDTRTSLCFAYRWGGINCGGPSLATVPCESIPPQLLTLLRQP